MEYSRWGYAGAMKEDPWKIAKTYIKLLSLEMFWPLHFHLAYRKDSVKFCRKQKGERGNSGRGEMREGRKNEQREGGRKWERKKEEGNEDRGWTVFRSHHLFQYVKKESYSFLDESLQEEMVGKTLWNSSTCNHTQSFVSSWKLPNVPLIANLSPRLETEVRIKAEVYLWIGITGARYVYIFIPYWGSDSPILRQKWVGKTLSLEFI